MKTDVPKTIFLHEYEPPFYLADHINLEIDIYEGYTRVKSDIHFKVNRQKADPLVLNGENLKLISVAVNSNKLEEDEYTVDDKTLTILCPLDEEFTLQTEVEISPEKNTALEGLYKSQDTYCTQCEAEGFRKITYFLDRPDVMSVFKVKVSADKDLYPVLLSNGNLIEEGDDHDNRHYTLWHDPFPKPCYLFALVAGDLKYIEDTFTTKSHREVILRIYVRDGDQSQCDHAMESLKASMKWDEDKYGCEYQLDRFNIVAVSDFNMGAMENTSLNIFNTALVLAHKDTATDIDFERVEGVIAHEYFHNWTGNRITCRDWFQLSLKEGFTVFRDQQFSADMNSESVKRIDDVQALRRYQFPEDAGPLAHPIRPDNYIEINNFYTMTVYEKGAEVIRMQHTLLGEDKFRAATDFYFKEYDGQAITCDDFVECMQSQTDMDLTQFKLWYSQAGTPEVIASSEYDETDKIFKLTLEQVIPPTPGQPEKEAMHMPIKVGLVGPNGEDMVSRTLHLKKDKEEFIFENISSRPVPSILRDFSAPVNLKLDLSDEDLRFLMVNDNDGFNRWEAGQFYALRVMNEMIDFHEKGQSFPVDTDFLSSFTELLHSALHPETDKALLARSLTLPDIPIIAQNRRHVDPSVIYEVRNNIIKALIKFNRELFERIYEDNIEIEFSNSFESRSQRALKNVLLRYLLINKDDSSIRLAKTQYDSAHNMTDRLMAASVLSDTTSKEREEVLEDFYNRFKDYQLVIDKWFSIQAMALRPEVLDDILQLENHHDFNFSNPNRVRSLFGAFAMNNPVWFHSPDSRGYDFLKEGIIKLNTKNPQIAARLLTPMKEWRKYTPDRQEKMKSVLEEIANVPDISNDVYEIVSKSLA